MVLLAVGASITSAVHLIRRDKVVTDDGFFKLHYKLTAAIFFLFCLILTGKEMIGERIQCTTDAKPISDNYMNTYCYIQSTFSIRDHFGKKVGSVIPYPGVGTHRVSDKSDRVYHSYYLWAPVVLFLQALTFIIPHRLWKMWESGKVRSLANALNGDKLTLKTRGGKTTKQSLLVEYLTRSRHSHGMYAAKYVICEVLNLVVVVGNIFFVDKFLGGTFLTYGIDVLKLIDKDYTTRTDPLVRVFPKVTKCYIHSYGPSGTIQVADALCVLAQNILNEKVFIVVWFWLVFLSVITAIGLLYHLFVLFSPGARLWLLQQRGKYSIKVANLETVVQKADFGDFHLLYLIGINTPILTFGQLLNELGEKWTKEDIRGTQQREPTPASSKIHLPGITT